MPQKKEDPQINRTKSSRSKKVQSKLFIKTRYKIKKKVSCKIPALRRWTLRWLSKTSPLRTVAKNLLNSKRITSLTSPQKNFRARHRTVATTIQLWRTQKSLAKYPKTDFLTKPVMKVKRLKKNKLFTSKFHERT